MRGRIYLQFAVVLMLGASASATEPPVDAALARLATQARPGILAVVVMDPATDRVLAAVNPDRPMPMQSVMKAPLAAFVFSKVDAGALQLYQKVRLTRGDLSVPRSPINDAFPGRDTYTVAELLRAAAGDSDNTAADVLLALVGGPRAATAWMRRQGFEGIRIDRFEREFQAESVGLSGSRLKWADEARYAAAVAAVPEARQRAAARAVMVDPRDTATPRATARFLARLARGELLSAASTQLLLDIMARTATGARRLRAGLAPGVGLAHKTGTSRTILGVNQATNDVGLVTYPDGRRMVIAAFLAGSTSGEAQRESVLADVARAASTGY